MPTFLNNIWSKTDSNNAADPSLPSPSPKPSQEQASQEVLQPAETLAEKTSAVENTGAKTDATEGTHVPSAAEGGASASAPESNGVNGAHAKPRKHLSSPPVPNHRRFSFRSLAYFYGRGDVEEVEAKERQEVVQAAKKASFLSSRTDKQAHNTAIMLRSAIIAPAGPQKCKPLTRKDMGKVKSQLMQPKSANMVIAHLRNLTTPSGPVVGKDETGTPLVTTTQGPIHAVSLDKTEAEIDELYFSKLTGEAGEGAEDIATVTSASLSSLTSALGNLQIVNLITSPDLGLSEGADGNGILSGALPAPKTVIDGMNQITPQLMGLGFALGKAVIPSHAGLYPPLDRMSVITYWWGLEIAMPEPTMRYLDSVKSISHALVNFLTALSILDAGIREALPFIRYISQFIDFEWSTIKAQDKGKGVVCAATWIMPAALVPRPWDFPDSPKGQPNPANPSPAAASQTNGSSEDLPPPVMVPSLVVTPATLPRDARRTMKS